MRSSHRERGNMIETYIVRNYWTFPKWIFFPGAEEHILLETKTEIVFSVEYETYETTEDQYESFHEEENKKKSNQGLERGALITFI